MIRIKKKFIAFPDWENDRKPTIERRGKRGYAVYIPMLLMQVHKTTGTTTLSLPPVRTASVSEAREAHVPVFQAVPARPDDQTGSHHDDGSSEGEFVAAPPIGAGYAEDQPPALSQRLAADRPTKTATAKAALPSRLLPPPQTHLRWPQRRPMREAAESPRPTQTTPETMLTSRAGTSQPARAA